MSSLNRDVSLKKKPPLPSEWVAYPSKSYPNKVYYYNVVTGCSSWDEPKQKLYPKSVAEQHGKKLANLVSKSDTSSTEMASHKPCKLTMAAALDNRSRSNTICSSVLPCKSRRLTLTHSKNYERHRMEREPAFPRVKDCKRINDKMITNEKISVGNETSSFDGAECKHHNSRGACEEAVFRKRRMKQNSTRSVEVVVDSDVGRPPSKQIKLGHDADCQNSNYSIMKVLHSNKKNNYTVLPSTPTANSGSTSGSSKIHLQTDDMQHILKARRQNKISLEHAAVSSGLRNTKTTHDYQASDAGLATRRLKALRTKLGKELVNEGTSGGQEREVPPQKIRKSGISSRRRSSGCSEIGIPVHSPQILQKETLFLKNDCSSVTDDKKLERTVPDPCQRTYLKRGFEKCNAAKRLEALQKKLAMDRDRDCKEINIQKGNSPIKIKLGPESCARGDRSPSDDVSSHCSNISNKGRFLHNMKQSLPEQRHNLTGHLTTDEDELMEWEPIEDDKILSHIQEVRTQIQRDDRGIQKLDYGVSPIFSANEKQEWFIVLDSNVLISNIKDIEELRDTDVKGLGLPVLVIPWQVLQELDILKDQRKVKSQLLVARARMAISFLHSNFMSNHRRVRGQSALDAMSEDFKVEVPDDAILHCCLQIAQRTNQVILLSNDKNLCNKAIVNGIRAYKMSEIHQALQGWGTESSEIALTDVIPVDKAVSVVDSVQCRLKLLLKELLSRVLENEMIKVYGTTWKRIVIIKPPWTLSDILICMRKHWICVFSFLMPAEAKPILESLNEFFGNITKCKGYGHAFSDVTPVLKQSLRLCMLIQSEDYLELASRCIKDIEVLQKHCEQTWSALKEKSEEEKYKYSVKNDAQHEDIQTITDVLKDCWNSVHFFCAVMCDVLGFEHHTVYDRPQIFPTPDTIRERLPYYCHSVHTLIKNITRIGELPMSVLTVDHEAVKQFFLTLTNFIPSKDIEEKINPELILKFCTTESTRSILETAHMMFQKMVVILDRGMNYFRQCDNC